MDLILWRHAEAEEGSQDLSRALTRKGQQQGRKMADWLGRRLPNNYRVLASEAKRSQQTAAFLSKSFQVIPSLNPGASVHVVLAVVEQYHERDTVVLVGHQPYLGQVAAQLIAAEPQYWHVKKSAIWWLGLCDRMGGEPVRLKAMLIPSMLTD